MIDNAGLLLQTPGTSGAMRRSVHDFDNVSAPVALSRHNSFSRILNHACIQRPQKPRCSSSRSRICRNRFSRSVRSGAAPQTLHPFLDDVLAALEAHHQSSPTHVRKRRRRNHMNEDLSLRKILVDVRMRGSNCWEFVQGPKSSRRRRSSIKEKGHINPFVCPFSLMDEPNNPSEKRSAPQFQITEYTERDKF